MASHHRGSKQQRKPPPADPSGGFLIGDSFSSKRFQFKSCGRCKALRTPPHHKAQGALRERAKRKDPVACLHVPSLGKPQRFEPVPPHESLHGNQSFREFITKSGAYDGWPATASPPSARCLDAHAHSRNTKTPVVQLIPSLRSPCRDRDVSSRSISLPSTAGAFSNQAGLSQTHCDERFLRCVVHNAC